VHLATAARAAVQPLVERVQVMIALCTDLPPAADSRKTIFSTLYPANGRAAPASVDHVAFWRFDLGGFITGDLRANAHFDQDRGSQVILNPSDSAQPLDKRHLSRMKIPRHSQRTAPEGSHSKPSCMTSMAPSSFLWVRCFNQLVRSSANDRFRLSDATTVRVRTCWAFAPRSGHSEDPG
jgi:hypothetical protein